MSGALLMSSMGEQEAGTCAKCASFNYWPKRGRRRRSSLAQLIKSFGYQRRAKRTPVSSLSRSSARTI